jgi:hypothetical protein
MSQPAREYEYEITVRKHIPSGKQYVPADAISATRAHTMSDKGDIENTTWREEFERLLKSILPESPGGIAMTRDGAIFVDEIAKMAYQIAKQYKKNSPDAELELVFANIFKYLIDETVIHELGHTLGGLTEEETKEATRRSRPPQPKTS